jgi:hypothetical protein
VAVLSAKRTLPDLTVTVTAHTNGRAWLADTCCTRVWLSRHLNAEGKLRGLRDAARVLMEHNDAEVLPWMPRQRDGSADCRRAVG